VRMFSQVVLTMITHLRMMMKVNLIKKLSKLIPKLTKLITKLSKMIMKLSKLNTEVKTISQVPILIKTVSLSDPK
jgi:hypothetical protein